jgi:hypothetical protein
VGRPRGGAFLSVELSVSYASSLAYLITSIPLVHLVPSCGEVAYRSSRPNPPRDGRGDLTNIARAIGEQEDVALVRGWRHAVEDSTDRYEALPWPCAIRK